MEKKYCPNCCLWLPHMHDVTGHTCVCTQCNWEHSGIKPDNAPPLIEDENGNTIHSVEQRNRNLDELWYSQEEWDDLPEDWNEFSLDNLPSG